MSVSQGANPPIELTLDSPNPTANMVIACIIGGVHNCQYTPGPRIRAFRVNIESALNSSQVDEIRGGLDEPEGLLKKQYKALVTSFEYFGRTDKPGGQLTLIIDTDASDLVLNPAPMPT